MAAGTGGTVSPASGFFNSGQAVNITATPNAGFTFNGWTGTGTGSFTGAANPAPAPKAAPGQKQAAAAAGQPADIGDICLLPDIARFAH